REPLPRGQDVSSTQSLAEARLNEMVKNCKRREWPLFPGSMRIHNVWTLAGVRAALTALPAWKSHRPTAGHVSPGLRARSGLKQERVETMQNRRGFLLTLVTGFVAMAFVVGTVFADELLGVLTKVDVDGKKLTVVEKDTDKEVVVKTTEDTE